MKKFIQLIAKKFVYYCPLKCDKVKNDLQLFYAENNIDKMLSERIVVINNKVTKLRPSTNK